MSSAHPKRTGRRRGLSESRERIAAAARLLFGELGYERTTFRRIASAAGVDPALVVHFYGSKEDLFRQVMRFPEGVSDALVHVAEEPSDRMGRRFAELAVGALENPATKSIFLGRIRSASSHPDAAALVRETVTRDLSRLTSAITQDRPDARAVLLGAHIVGIALARYIVRVEPLASLPPAEVIDLIAPTFQRYLAEPLSDADGRDTA